MPKLVVSPKEHPPENFLVLLKSSYRPKSLYQAGTTAKNSEHQRGPTPGLPAPCLLSAQVNPGGGWGPSSNHPSPGSSPKVSRLDQRRLTIVEGKEESSGLLESPGAGPEAQAICLADSGRSSQVPDVFQKLPLGSCRQQSLSPQEELPDLLATPPIALGVLATPFPTHTSCPGGIPQGSPRPPGKSHSHSGLSSTWPASSSLELPLPHSILAGQLRQQPHPPSWPGPPRLCKASLQRALVTLCPHTVSPASSHNVSPAPDVHLLVVTQRKSSNLSWPPFPTCPMGPTRPPSLGHHQN